jgi:hypothetical protein
MRPSNIYDAFKSYLYTAPVVPAPVQVQAPPIPAAQPPVQVQPQAPIAHSVPSQPPNRHAEEQLLADLYGEIRNLKYTLSHLLLREQPREQQRESKHETPQQPAQPLLVTQTQPETTFTTKLIWVMVFVFLLLIVVLLIVVCVYQSKSAAAAEHLKYISLQRSYSVHPNKYVQPW